MEINGKVYIHKTKVCALFKISAPRVYRYAKSKGMPFSDALKELLSLKQKSIKPEKFTVKTSIDWYLYKFKTRGMYEHI